MCGEGASEPAAKGDARGFAYARHWPRSLTCPCVCARPKIDYAAGENVINSPGKQRLPSARANSKNQPPGLGSFHSFSRRPRIIHAHIFFGGQKRARALSFRPCSARTRSIATSGLRSPCATRLCARFRFVYRARAGSIVRQRAFSPSRAQLPRARGPFTPPTFSTYARGGPVIELRSRR